MNPEQNLLNKEEAFLLFAAFAGDVTRTAHALNVPEVSVLRAAEELGWLHKLEPILALKKSTRPGDLERAINRALNFVQAHQMRLFVSRVIHRLTNFSETEFEEYLFQYADKNGNTHPKLTTRALADLASALEKSQAMSYQALSDTTQDRVKRKESEDGETAAIDIHARIAAAMAEIATDKSPRALLLEAQIVQANQIAEVVKPKENPNDNDNH